MSDHLHPAIDIPCGGLWEGACVRRDGSAFGVVIDDDSVEGDVLCALTHASSDRLRLQWIDVTDLSLRLDDPLGLGLAGLAGRVAERLGWPAGYHEHIAHRLATTEPWTRGPGEARAVLTWCAAYLARLDRLAAAVDPTYTVRSGVVPQWSRLEPVDGDPRYGWTLLVPLPSGDSVGKCFLPLDEPDPLAALGAALEVCGG